MNSDFVKSDNKELIYQILNKSNTKNLVIKTNELCI